MGRYGATGAGTVDGVPISHYRTVPSTRGHNPLHRYGSTPGDSLPPLPRPPQFTEIFGVTSSREEFQC